MSAELLRQAATDIREKCPWAFHLAVADWLETTADNADRTSLYARGIDCQKALAVARAHLGEAS